ncbi:MAG: DUF11 domain-containing protein [Hellea sp.]|nr:DUF11 domain-containing protein [Hellea sp.]
MKSTTTYLKALLGASALTAFTALSAHAGGTSAGTNVQNTFTLNYDVNDTPQPVINNVGNETEFTVDRKIDLSVDSTVDTSVTPGENQRILTYTLTNEGNDAQQYDFNIVDEAVNAPLVGFDASPYVVWYEDPLNAGVYIEFTGSNYPELTADQSITVQIRADIPTSANDDEREILSLVATTLDTSGNVVTEDTDGNAILGAAENVFADDPASAEASTGDSGTVSDGNESATAFYVVSTAELTAVKAVDVFSQDGAGCATIPGTPTSGYAIPGACVEYVITAENTGSEDATDIVISDTLATDLTFIAVTSSGFTGGTFSSEPAANHDCATIGTPCDIVFDTATLASGTPSTPTVGTITIRALVK